MRKIIPIIMSILVFLAAGAVIANADNEERFIGSRTTVFIFDRSDLLNFIDGGYDSFEKAINDSKPDWCSCEIEKMKRDISVTLSFSFNSKDEYESHIKELLGYRPVIVYQPGESFMFVEGFDSSELLNNVQTRLINENVLEELKFDRLLNIESSTMTINGQAYTTKDNFDIRSGNSIKFDRLEINTEEKEDGGFERIIRVRVNDDNINKSDKDTLIRNFNAIGDDEASVDMNALESTLRFKAKSGYELSKKTLIAIGLTISTLENEKPQTDRVLVGCKERIGIKKVVNDGGQFQYIYSYPRYYNNLKAEKTTDLSVNDNTIRYSGMDGSFEYSYERGLRLSNIQIITNFSDPFKVSREIRLSVPVDSADVFENDILTVFSSVESEYHKTKVNTYVDGENKIYTIEYSSNKSENISGFTKTVLKGTDSLDYHIGILPIQRNSINEVMDIGNIINNMIPVTDVESIYILAEKSTITGSNMSEYSFFNDEYAILSDGSSNIGIEFRTLNKKIIIIISVIAIIVLVLICFVIIVVKNKIKKQKRSGGINKTVNLKFCTQCGVRIPTGARFCTNCGRKFRGL